MRQKLDRLVDRAFPGMGIRPVYLTVISTWLMVLYWYWSRSSRVPNWFIGTMVDWTGIHNTGFHKHLWSHLVCFVLLALTPAIFVWFTDRMTFRELGLGFRKSGREFLIVAVLFLAFVPVIYYLSTTAGFQRTYPRLKSTETDMVLFAVFHLAYLLKWASWEFFFRGFMLFSFKKDFGTRAVLISTIPFTLMHYGKPDLETMSAVLAGFILCWLALKGKSIWPGVAIHAAVAATMELFATTWFWDLWK
ncbi:MAG: membrane protease YdiL (CAAX protease family) [Kiritimatiellia bacterium]|jgi:membrane protease YdiL (CAAX protease family)